MQCLNISYKYYVNFCTKAIALEEYMRRKIHTFVLEYVEKFPLRHFFDCFFDTLRVVSIFQHDFHLREKVAIKTAFNLTTYAAFF